MAAEVCGTYRAEMTELSREGDTPLVAVAVFAQDRLVSASLVDPRELAAEPERERSTL